MAAPVYSDGQAELLDGVSFEELKNGQQSDVQLSGRLSISDPVLAAPPPWTGTASPAK